MHKKVVGIIFPYDIDPKVLAMDLDEAAKAGLIHRKDKLVYNSPDIETCQKYSLWDHLERTRTIATRNVDTKNLYYEPIFGVTPIIQRWELVIKYVCTHHGRLLAMNCSPDYDEQIRQLLSENHEVEFIHVDN